MARVLIVDDDRNFCSMVAEHVQRAGHGVSLAHNLRDGFARARTIAYDVVFLDVRFPDGSGLDLLPRLRTGIFPPEVIIVTGFGDAEGAELAIRHGAWDYVRKESSIQTLVLSLTRALQYRESRRGAVRHVLFNTPDMVGNAPSFRAALTTAARAASDDVSVLVGGETGTGKELLAWAIHRNSLRSGGPFIVVDCTALPHSLVGSILFGHERGAFTSADRRRVGLIKEANGGTLFLDEVGEMPMDVQKAFLRVLQEHRFQPIGSNETVESDFRVIAATNRDLERLVKEGGFRRDLLFRLRGLTVNLPPLRERKEDIPLLITHFLTRHCRALDRDIKGVSENFTEASLVYDWPGNVRELAQAVSGAIAQAGTEPVLYASHLPPHIRARVVQADQGLTPTNRADSAEYQRVQGVFDLSRDLPPLFEVRNLFEKAYLEQLVKRAGNDIDTACRISGVSRPHVYTLLRKYGLKLQGQA